MTGNLHNLGAFVAIFVQSKELSPSRMSLLIGTICGLFIAATVQCFSSGELVNLFTPGKTNRFTAIDSDCAAVSWAPVNCLSTPEVA
jgi:hypothetical protein